jgi:hypothetical protein
VMDRGHAGIARHCLIGLQQRRHLLCHHQALRVSSARFAACGPITSLIPRWKRLAIDLLANWASKCFLCWRTVRRIRCH